MAKLFLDTITTKTVSSGLGFFFHFLICRFLKVSELMESGKSLLQELSNDFEERMIAIHKEQMEKWQEEIKELRLLDASNEEINALLHNARYLLHNVQSDPKR